MKREEITVAGLIETIESGEKENIRLYSWRLAQLFGVYESAIRANIKALIQSKIVTPNKDCLLVQTGMMLLPEIHDLEKVIALAFRIHTPDTAKFRDWIIEKVIHKKDNKVIVLGVNHQIVN